MPKLRNGSTDTAKFTDWLARKIRNHNPLQELKATGGVNKKFADRYKTKASEGVHLIDAAEGVIFATNGTRAFRIRVEEVAVDEVPVEQLVSVGS
jgi:hypothetical protein